jgi:hypothetical protein
MHPCRCHRQSLGYWMPADLIGADPLAVYKRLGALLGGCQDPCVLDVFIAVTRLLDGEPARPWWTYSAERRRHPELRAPATPPPAPR